MQTRGYKGTVVPKLALEEYYFPSVGMALLPQPPPALPTVVGRVKYGDPPQPRTLVPLLHEGTECRRKLPADIVAGITEDLDIRILKKQEVAARGRGAERRCQCRTVVPVVVCTVQVAAL